MRKGFTFRFLDDDQYELRSSVSWQYRSNTLYKQVSMPSSELRPKQAEFVSLDDTMDC